MTGSTSPLLEADPEGLFCWLCEGKAIGTAPETDLVLFTDPTVLAQMHPEAFREARHVGATVGLRKMREIRQRTLRALLAILEDYDSRRIDSVEMRTEMVRTMKRAWRDSFLAGIRAAGQPPSGEADLVAVEPVDEKWLKGAITHEMTFLNKFVADVIVGEGRLPYPKRAQMYVDALRSFYDSARVIGLPATSIIYWLGPNDKRTCASCAYMFAHSPFTKRQLPTTPRSGLTLCLTNCRDRLLIKQSTPQKVVDLDQSGLPRGTHVRNLRKIKRFGYI